MFGTCISTQPNGLAIIDSTKKESFSKIVRTTTTNVSPKLLIIYPIEYLYNPSDLICIFFSAASVINVTFETISTIESIPNIYNAIFFLLTLKLNFCFGTNKSSPIIGIYIYLIITIPLMAQTNIRTSFISTLSLV